KQALVAVVVLVPHAPVAHVGDGLEAAVRKVGEAGDVVIGAVGAEFVKQQVRIDDVQLPRTDQPRLPDHGAVGIGRATEAADDAGGVGVAHGCRASRRQARWMRGLRAKSGAIVAPLMSSQRAKPATAASSRRKRRKLLEKYSTPPGASRATAARSRSTCARCTSKSPARLELEKVGGSQNTRSYWPVSARSHCITSACTRRWWRPPRPFSCRLAAHHSR